MNPINQPLQYLLPTLGVSEFFEQYWEKAFLLQQTHSPLYFEPFFNWDLFLNCINYTDAIFNCRVVRDGKKLYDSKSMDGIYYDTLSQNKASFRSSILALCEPGGTLKIQHIHNFHPTLKKFANELGNELGEFVQVNAYASWPGGQSSGWHYDGHEVFALQLEGKKHWQLYDETYAGYDPADYCFKYKDCPPSGQIHHHVTQKGDILFIPKGLYHSAAPDPYEPSLHLTVGIQCRTGISFLEWLSNRCKKVKVFAQNLPTTIRNPVDSAGYDRERLKSHILEIQDSLNLLLSSDQLIDAFNNDIRTPHPHSEFGIPKSRVLLSDLVAQIRDELNEKGYSQPATLLNYDEFLSICNDLGIVYATTDIKYNPNRDKLIHSTEEIAFHNDDIDARYIAWHCQEEAGDAETLLLDFEKIRPRLSESCKRGLGSISLLRNNQSVSIVRDTEKLALFYIPWLVKPGETDLEKQALHELNQAIQQASDTETISILHKKNRCLFIDDHRMLHGRKKYDPTTKRFLKRVWIK